MTNKIYGKSTPKSVIKRKGRTVPLITQRGYAMTNKEAEICAKRASQELEKTRRELLLLK